MAKSIIAHHETTPLSPTMVLERYEYVYIKGFDANRAYKRHKAGKRTGWVQKAIDREDENAEQGGLWIVKEVWQKKKERKRAKKDK